MKLIINADDLGLNPRVNHAVRKAAESGTITSATILANSEYWDEIVEIVRFSKMSYGVHLNLTEGKSLTNSIVLKRYGVIDSNGIFTNNREFIKNIIPLELKNVICIEFKEQIKLVKDRIGVISHLDGHHHCHTWFGVEDVIKKITTEFNINAIRNTYSWPISNPIQSLNNNCRFKKLLKQEIKTKYFTSYENAVNKINKLKFLHEFMLKGKTIELMCHPGHIKYKREYDLVMEHEIEKILDCKVELINYLDL